MLALNQVKFLNFQVFLWISFINTTGKYQIYIEDALKKEEIVSEIMTRAEAIAKLKEAKERLDLEMMTQEEYDKLKKELTPIIKQ